MNKITLKEGQKVLTETKTVTTEIKQSEIENQVALWEKEVLYRTSLLEEAQNLLKEYKDKLKLFK